MLSLILFLLASFGVSNIVTGGKIFQWLRDLLKPVPALGYWVQCPMCIGFPIGVVWRLAGMDPGTGLSFWWDLVAAGSIASGWCWVMRVALHKMGEDEL